MSEAKDWLQKAKACAAETDDYRTDEARIFIADEKPDEALRLLRDTNSPEAVGLMLEAIIKKHGAQEAITYYSQHVRDVEKLAGPGLFSFVSKVLETGQYELAEELLSKASDLQIEDCPALLSLRASVRISICGPESERKNLLHFVPVNPIATRLSDAPEKIELRRAALKDVEGAIDKITELNLPVFLGNMGAFAMWLRLSHPDKEIRGAAKRKLKEEMKEPQKAVQYVRFAIDYDVEFDEGALNDYLNTRKKMGGWTNSEAFAAFSLAIGRKTPEQVLELIKENRDDLSKCLNPNSISYIEAEALAKSGAIKEANALVDSMQAEGPGDEPLIALRHIIKEIEGEDALLVRRASFEETKSDGDRRLLIHELLSRNLYSEAVEHLEYFFSSLPTVDDALEIAKCFAMATDAKGLESFMARPDVQVLSERNRELKCFEPWAAYYSGYVKEASIKLKPLTESGADRNIRQLFMNLAVESGNWEKLHKVLYDYLEKKDDLSGPELIAAAETGRVIGFSKTEALIDAAVAKGLQEDNPHILVNAYAAVTHLGIENKKEEAITWLKRAKDLSGPDGPLQRYHIRDIVELSKEWQKNHEFVYDLVKKGDVPLCIAAEPLNITFTGIIGGNLIRNSAFNDWRAKVGIPLFAGNRNFGLLGGANRIAIDRSALMVLGFLELLDPVFSTFDKIIIARDSMGEFLEEIGRIRFHQPSQVEAAKRLLDHIIGSRLHVLENVEIDNEFSANDLGSEIQRLLSAAKAEGGIVVVAPLLFKSGSLMGEEVDPGLFMDLICELPDLINFLKEEEAISEDDVTKLEADLHIPGRRWEKDINLERSNPLYLDNTVVNMLERAGLIEIISNVFPIIYVDTSTKEHALALGEYAKAQGDVEDLVHRIRNTVVQGIESGKLKISPVCKTKEINRGGDRRWGTSLVNLLTDPGDAESIIVDDRAINKRDKNPLEGGETVLIATSIDLLYTLFHQEVLTKMDLIKALRKLRKGGALFVPIELDEFVEQAQKSSKGQDSFEFRAISDYIDMACARRILRIPEEKTWFARMVLEMMKAIGVIWKQSDSTDSAIAASRRILEIIPDPVDWVPPEANSEVQNWILFMRTMYISYLGNISTLNNEDKEKAYRHWIESEIIQPLSHKHPSLLPEAAEHTRHLFLDLYRTMSEENGNAI